MDDTELVAGPSAGSYDLWRQVLNVASIGVPLLLGVILNSVGVGIEAVGGFMIALFAVFFAAALYVGARVTRAMRGEMEAGYSTLYDVADFELRDARTLELLRPADVVPENPGRRSLLAGMFRVKPGTMLAKRIKDDED